MKRALLLGLLLAACSGNEAPPGPSAGLLDLRLTGPAGAGSAVLIVEGGAIDSVEATTFFTASAPYSGTAVKVLLAGTNLTGTVARIHVPDQRVAYTATVMQVAEGATYQLVDPAGFVVNVVKR